MSRFLAGFLTLLFSALVMLTTQAINPGEVALSGGAMVAAVICGPVFFASWALERFGFRYPRLMSLGVALLMSLLALHLGLIGWAIVAAFTLLQYRLRRSSVFRLRGNAAGHGKP